MSETTRISVVVPFFNSQSYIEACIRALLAQSYPSSLYEVIMIDNNSTDCSSAIVRKFPRIKLLSERKQGAYAARNQGITVTSGEIIAFTDSDCVPSLDWLNNVNTAMRDSRVWIVIGIHEFAADSSVLRLLEAYENEKKNYIFGSKEKTAYYGYGNNMAVRKSLFGELGPFVEIPRGSDTVFVRKCVDRYSCDAVYYSRAVKVRHLEIDSVRRYFEKVFTYGKSIQRYGSMANARAMTSGERLLIFWNTVKHQQYSWTKSILLLGLLFVGLFYWIVGGISAASIFQRTLVPEQPQDI